LAHVATNVSIEHAGQREIGLYSTMHTGVLRILDGDLERTELKAASCDAALFEVKPPTAAILFQVHKLSTLSAGRQPYSPISRSAAVCGSTSRCATFATSDSRRPSSECLATTR